MRANYVTEREDDNLNMAQFMSLPHLKEPIKRL
jgi:hypothetical protein